MKLTPVEKNAYDALAYLIQAARLPITAKSVKEQLYLHPDFPSLLSMSDVLTEWKVSNLATRIRPEQLVEIPLPAIAHLEIYGGYFAPVRKVTNEQIEWLDTNRGWQTDPLTDFGRKWNGVILLMEPNGSSGETNYRQKKREADLHNARLPVVIVGLLLCFVCVGELFLPNTLFDNSTLWGLLLTKLMGIAVTTLLLWHTVDANNSLLRSLCSLDNRTDCNSVLTAKTAKLWGWLGWSDIGFTYFSGSFLALLMGLSIAQPSVLSWLIVLNVLALPYTLYSVYYQYKVAKSWCTLCLLVQVLLWAEFALGIPHWQSVSPVVNGQTIALFGLAFLVPVVLWVLLRKPLQEAMQVFPLRRELQKAKFNPEYVESLFARQPQMPPVFAGMRVVTMGNPGAEHTLTIVTNPLCGPCRRLHPELEALVERTDTINCQFVFIGSAATVPIIQKLLGLPPAEVEQQLQLHARWSELAQVTGTPTLYLNGRQLPLAYTLGDVENLCRVLPASPQLMESVDSHKSMV